VAAGADGVSIRSAAQSAHAGAYPAEGMTRAGAASQRDAAAQLLRQVGLPDDAGGRYLHASPASGSASRLRDFCGVTGWSATSRPARSMSRCRRRYSIC
jgi:hypothetical protein